MSDPVFIRFDDDDIDLFALLETLWAGKLVILATTVLPLIVGLGLLLNSTPLFEVKAPYVVPVAFLSTFGCSDQECRKTMVAQRVVSHLNGEWRSVDSGSALALTTASPKPIAGYQSDLEELNQILRTEMLSDAEAEEEFFESEIDDDLFQFAAGSLLTAMRVRFLLERDERPLAFGVISISEVKKSSTRFIFFPAFFGAVLGSFFVLLRKAFRDRQVAKGPIES
jgi:hypothetical protein